MMELSTCQKMISGDETQTPLRRHEQNLGMQEIKEEKSLFVHILENKESKKCRNVAFFKVKCQKTDSRK